MSEASPPNPVGIAICAVFRDEAPYLAEWVEFHRLVGVEHFLLYDDRSCDGGPQVLAPYGPEGLASITDCATPLASGGQDWAYDDGLDRARGRFRWLAFIDIDEFLFSPEHESLVNALAEFEQSPGALVNWQVYGSSGLESRPDGLVIESFTRRARTDWVRNRRVTRPCCSRSVRWARRLSARGPSSRTREGLSPTGQPSTAVGMRAGSQPRASVSADVLHAAGPDDLR